MADGQFTSLDLFAGCGGLSLGLHHAGWEGLFAIEKDRMAFDTLRANLVADSARYPAYQKWPSWLPVAAHDLRALLADDEVRRRLADLSGTVTLVAGGPPCQGFSVGGARNGNDARNDLVAAQLDVVRLVRPKVTVVENVEGITRPFVSRPNGERETGRSVADAVRDELHQLGYKTAFSIIDASHFGVPQTRRRAIIIGIREDLGIEPERVFAELESLRPEFLQRLGLPTDRPVTAAEAIDDLWGSGERVTCPDSLKYESVPYRDAEHSYARQLRRDIPTGAIPDSHRFSVHGMRILDLYRRAHATQPHGRLSKAFLLQNGTKKDKKVLIDANEPVSTITTHPDEFIHFAEPRNITVREMARLQSFPDDFTFLGRYTINGPRRRFDVARCSQVGNAVPPRLGYAIGLAIRRVLP